jgi:hypothetical protein
VRAARDAHSRRAGRGVDRGGPAGSADRQATDRRVPLVLPAAAVVHRPARDPRRPTTPAGLAAGRRLDIAALEQVALADAAFMSAAHRVLVVTASPTSECCSGGGRLETARVARRTCARGPGRGGAVRPGRAGSVRARYCGRRRVLVVVITMWHRRSLILPGTWRRPAAGGPCAGLGSATGTADYAMWQRELPKMHYPGSLLSAQVARWRDAGRVSTGRLPTGRPTVASNAATRPLLCWPGFTPGWRP